MIIYTCFIRNSPNYKSIFYGLYFIGGSYLISRCMSTKVNKNVPNLNSFIKNVLIGILLGDGWLEKQKVNARLRFEQSDIHKEFFFYVYKFFSEFCKSSPRLRERWDKRTGKVYYTWHFSTKSYPMFTEVYDLFYVNKKKVVPVNIKELLSDVGLAIWIQCDGWKHNKGVTLATNAFSDVENQLLIDALNEKFALDCRLIRDHEHPSIHIPYNQMSNLQKLVLPYMHESFLYKIYL
uniref:Homing endonuclease LAGLIDADG domain-containing protein n=1 Tax=Wolfiporia cocos TaxID=81056 RepID=A0A7G7YDZ2_9APHY|nr:hypothetical protein [Wolfiporia cocos]